MAFCHVGGFSCPKLLCASLSGSIVILPTSFNAIRCPHVSRRVSSSHWCKSSQAPEAGSGGEDKNPFRQKGSTVGPACRAGLSPKGEPWAMLSRPPRLRLCKSPCPQGRDESRNPFRQKGSTFYSNSTSASSTSTDAPCCMKLTTTVRRCWEWTLEMVPRRPAMAPVFTMAARPRSGFGSG